MVRLTIVCATLMVLVLPTAWAQAPGSAPAVTVSQAVKTCFDDTVDVAGLLAPREEIQVRPDREGLQIAQVMVAAGDSVTSGQLLARLTAPGDTANAGATIQAPVAGLIRSVSAVVGATASTRADPMFRIIVQGDIELQADVVVTQIAKLTVNQPARVRVVGAGELRGTVGFISPVVNPMTQLGAVRITIVDGKGLRVGTFARASIVTAQQCGVAVPLSAVLYSRDGAVVQTVRSDHVESRRVTVGLISQGAVEIRDGLREGDLVVLKAGAFLREGDRVKPVTVQ